jgi:hypothetical protein
VRFDTTPHPCYCGIDWHARTLYVGILNHQGAIVLHRHLKASSDALLKLLAPYRAALVMAGECLCTWDGLADLCAQEGIPFGRGHALSMQAIPGGQATHDELEAHTLAVLRRGGLRPHASGSPAARRAPRDRRRRRLSLTRPRAALLPPVRHTNRQDHRPASGEKMA